MIDESQPHRPLQPTGRGLRPSRHDAADCGPRLKGQVLGGIKRREFLHDASGALLAGCVGAGALAGNARAAAAAGPGPQAEGDSGRPDARGPRDRLVVSTWWFGVAANGAAWEALRREGAHPLDAVEAGARVAEADPEVNSVGYGGLPNAEGVVQLDASVMRGDTLGCGAVASLENVLHPISVARLVMERTPHVLLVGPGALAFARAQGFEEQDLLSPKAKEAWEQWKAQRGQPGARAAAEPFEVARASSLDHDTIGMIALDGGRFATAVTTSGLAWKLPGRVGDSPIIGAGSYCDDLVGAAVSTGVGEEVIRTGGCVAIVEAMRRGLPPRRASIDVLHRIRRAQDALGRQGDVAFIAVSRGGEVWGGSLLPGFEYAYTDGDGTRRIQGEVVA